MAQKYVGQIYQYDRYGEKSSPEFKWDAIDRKILYYLRVNARFSNAFIASQLNIKRETVSYRIRRMEKHNFITGYSAMIDHNKLGFRHQIIFINLKSSKDEKNLLNYFVDKKEVACLHNCSGSFDVQITTTTKTEEEFNDFFNLLINRFHEVISKYELLWVVNEGPIGPTFYIDQNTMAKLGTIERKGSSFQKDFRLCNLSPRTEQIILDNPDKKILEELRLNARVSIADLSAKTGLVPATVGGRIRKLIQKKAIMAFQATPSFSLIGYQWYRLFFRVKNLDETKLLTFLKFQSNTCWVTSVIGKWNYLISIFAKNNADFYRIVDEIRTEFADNILYYDSVIIFNRFKEIERIE